MRNLRKHRLKLEDTYYVCIEAHAFTFLCVLLSCLGAIISHIKDTLSLQTTNNNLFYYKFEKKNVWFTHLLLLKVIV